MGFLDLTTNWARKENVQQKRFGQNVQAEQSSNEQVTSAQQQVGATQSELNGIEGEVSSKESILSGKESALNSAAGTLASAQSRLGNIPQTITDEETGEEKENPEYAAAAQAVAEAQEAYNTAQEEVNAAQGELDEAKSRQQTIQENNQTALDELSSAQEEYDSAMEDYEAEMEAQMEEEAQEENYDDVAEDETQNNETAGGAKDPIGARYNGKEDTVKIGDDEVKMDGNTTIHFGIDSNKNGKIDDNTEAMGYGATKEDMQKIAGEDGNISIKEYVDAGGIVVINGKAYDGEEALLALTKLNNPGFDKLSDGEKEAYMNRTLFNISEYKESGEVGDVVDLKGEEVGFLDFKQTFETDEDIANEYGYQKTGEKEEQVEYLNDGKLVQDGNLTEEGVSVVKDTLKKSAEDLGLTEEQVDNMSDEMIQKYFSIDKKGNLAFKNIDYWSHGEAKGKADCPWNFTTKIFGFDNLQNTDKLFNALFGESVKALSGHWNADLNNRTTSIQVVAPKTEVEQAVDEALSQAGGDWEMKDDDGTNTNVSFKNGKEDTLGGFSNVKTNPDGTITVNKDGQEVTITPQNGGYIIEYPSTEAMNGTKTTRRVVLTADGAREEITSLNTSAQGAVTTTRIYDANDTSEPRTPLKEVSVTMHKDGKGKTVTVVDKDGNKTVTQYDINGNKISE